MAVLSFNGMVNIGLEKAKAIDPRAWLYEASGYPAKGSLAKRATDLERMQIVCGCPGNRTIIVTAPSWGDFDPPKVIDSPWLEDMVIEWPIPMDLPEAIEKLDGAGYTGGFGVVVLRKPLGPDPNVKTEFIFTMGPGTYVAVNIDGKVGPIS